MVCGEAHEGEKMAGTRELEKQIKSVPPLVWLLGAVAVVGLVGSANASSRRAAAPVPTPAPGQPKPAPGQPAPGSCADVFNRTFYPKDKEELIKRTQGAIHRANPNLAFFGWNWERSGKQYSRLLAELLVTTCEANKVRLDVVMAICHIESHFNDYADLARVDNALRNSWNGSRWICAQPVLGPMQTKLCAMLDVGMSIETFKQVRTNRVATLSWTLNAGVRYIERLKDDLLKGESWCDVIRAYNQGPTAFNRGFTPAQKAEADKYLKKFLEVFPSYSDLRNI